MGAGDKNLCGAHTKRGATCTKGAGWGTDHPGHGTCKFHGGSTPDAILSAAKAEATIMGIGLDVTPHSALLECVRLTAGEVVYCTSKIRQLAPQDEVDHPIEITTTEGEEGFTVQRKEKVPMLNIWIRARAAAMDRLAKYAKMALDAGVDERRVRVAEGFASTLAPVLAGIFEQLELTPKQKEKAPMLLRQGLLELEGETMSSAASS